MGPRVTVGGFLLFFITLIGACRFFGFWALVGAMIVFAIIVWKEP